MPDPSRVAPMAAVSRAAGSSKPELPSDELLITRILSGETELYGTLITRYERPIVNYIYRMIGDYDQALDLAQEVFFKAYRSLERFDPSFRFSTWLYRIASNRSIDHLRKQAPVLLSLDEPSEADPGRREGAIQLKSAARGPEDLLASRQLGERISVAIDELPSAYRELVLLRHLQGLSYEDISRVKRLPLGTVKNRLFRAREILRRQLGE